MGPPTGALQEQNALDRLELDTDAWVAWRELMRDGARSADFACDAFS